MRQPGSRFLIVDPFTSLQAEVTESGTSVGGQVSESRRRTERQLVQYHRAVDPLSADYQSKQRGDMNAAAIQPENPTQVI